MTFGQEKGRDSLAGDFAATPQKSVYGDFAGYLESSPNSRIDQDISMYRAGYLDCHNELAPRIAQLEDALRWYVKHSVTKIFKNVGFDGAEASRQRSAQRFWQQRETDAA